MKDESEQLRLDMYYNSIVDELDTLDDFSLNDTIASYMYMVLMGQTLSSELSLSASELLTMALKIWQERHPITLPPCFAATQTKKASADGLFGVNYVYKWPMA